MPIVPTKDRPLNMPCDDPEGCKHFKAEVELEERIKRVCDLINNTGKVSKWKILNWLSKP